MEEDYHKSSVHFVFVFSLTSIKRSHLNGSMFGGVVLMNEIIQHIDTYRQNWLLEKSGCYLDWPIKVAASLSLVRRLTIPDDMKIFNIQACLALPDVRFIVSDFDYKRLLLFGNDSIFIREVVTLTNYPGDVCFVRNDLVAVTLGTAYKTVLVDIEKNEIIQTIALSHYCKGVASDGQKLILCSVRESSIVNLDDMSQLYLEVIGDCISSYNGNVFITFENNVQCCKSNGDSIWAFLPHDVSNVNSIQGLTLDKNGLFILPLGKITV